ncbi:cutinase family protein [Streptococcus sp. CSL10205-OR2]|uniref:cutinase family protein n=1 Tax=Streptococcus sp. CSL10205-OR2 TaxID=2980558 RepID=UPI0021D7D6C9|nr:cutinase family protein [Streptococcus sp. CSL10205-OR2]MCU9533561.1 alpha/beta hydrolase [Streptococcus sp. CSL10205-OR2]
MSNTNLSTFKSLYANLAQSTYTDRPRSFSKYQNAKSFRRINYGSDLIDKNGNVLTKGGQNLPNNGVFYLQPDKTVEAVTFGEHYKENGINLDWLKGYPPFDKKISEPLYKRGLLIDEAKGYNAYFLTDTKELSQETEKAYLAIRGSDGISLSSANDWINNLEFTVSDAYIEQAKLNKEAIKSKLAEMDKKAPNATLDLTAHSLGTMIAVQSVANLSEKELEKIENVVLFNGPDATESLKKMGLTQDQIDKVGEKTTYYLNPFDAVSMLNRDKPYSEQLGTVNVIVPLHYNTTFESPSSHDFGEYQIDDMGNILIASEDFHPELLEAGRKTALLDKKYLQILKERGYNDDIGQDLVNFLYNLEDRKLIDEFKKEAEAIAEEARLASIAWDKEHIPLYQEQIKTATGGQKIILRVQLLHSAAQLALFETEDKVEHLNGLIEDYKNQIDDKIKETHTEARNIALYLSSTEVGNLLNSFQMFHLWDNETENSTRQSAQNFKKNIEDFSTKVVEASYRIEEVDAENANLFSQ